MTPYQFRAATAAALFALLVFAVLAFGAVDTWALTIFELGVFALAAVWIVRFALGSLRPVWNPFYLPLALAVVWTAAQYALGLSVDRYQTRAEMLKWLALWLLFALACQCFTDQSIRRNFRTALVWLGFALCAFGLAQYFSAGDTMYWSIPLPEGKAFGPFVNRNHFATLMELIVPAALLLALRPSEQRLIYVVVYGLMAGAVIVGGSRVGVLLVALETIIVLIAMGAAPRSSRGSGRLAHAWLPLAGLAAAAVLVFAVAGSQKVFDRFDEPQPYSVRWTVVKATWQLFLQHPWRGYGAGTFGQVYPSAAPVDLGRAWSHAHNDPVQFAMEWGVAGLAVLAGLLLLLLIRRWPQEVWLRVILPLLTVLVHSWFDFPLQIPAVTAAWLLTLAQAVPAPSPNPEVNR
jgi:O-antigen ligase